jgi:uncharacterized protein (TIGR03382 family)
VSAASTSAWVLASALWWWAGQARAASVRVTTAAELQAAVANAQPGDTITVAAGTYVVTMPLDAHAAATSSQRIRVVAEAAHTAVVMAGAGATEAMRISGAWWEVVGVDVVGGDVGVHVVGGGGHATVQNAAIRAAAAGVRAECAGTTATCDGGVIDSCDVSATTVAAPDCTFAGVEIVGGADWLVRGLKVHDVAVDALCTAATTFGVVARANAQRLTVEVARITGVGIGIALGPASSPPTTCAVQTGLVRNVVVFGTSDDGVLLQNACDVKLHNATLWNDGRDFGGMRSVETRGTGTVDVSNVILNAPMVLAAGTTLTGAGNLTLPTPAEPSWFLDAAGGNFRLAAGAPAIDVGVTLTDVPTDYDGLARAQGAAYDVGAFERPLGGYPDGGLPMDGGATDGAVGGPGGATGGPTGGGQTGTPKESGCQCGFAPTGGVEFLLPLLLVLVIWLTARRRV